MTKDTLSGTEQKDVGASRGLGAAGDETDADFSIALDRTGRGFVYGEFKDRYGAVCSIQKSSLATEDCIWLGVTFNLSGKVVDAGRMHLTQAAAAALIPLLTHFVETGELPSPAPTRRPSHSPDVKDTQ